MNGPHDVGGMHGFGPIEVDRKSAPFHEPWEGRVFAMTMALAPFGDGSIDRARHAIERMGALYYVTPYFGRWLYGLRNRCVADGLLDENELAGVRKIRPDSGATERPAAIDPVSAVAFLRMGATAKRPDADAARFAIGDRVRARNVHVTGHTRLPRYVRGHVGTVVAARGTHVLPDARAHGLDENPEHLYSVRFSAKDLWGESADPTVAVYADLWQSYLEDARA